MRSSSYVSFIFFLLFIAYLMAHLVGCKSPEVKPAALIENTQSVQVSASSKVPALAWGKERADWSKHLVGEIEKSKMLEVVPKDFKDFCPGYPKLNKSERVGVLAELVSIMAKRESGFKADTTFTEGFNDAKGRAVISRGLLQISIESANSYGCGFKDAKELHSPLKNLSCSVKIIDRWIVKDQRFGGKVAGKWQGCARYWSVCRSFSRSYPVVTGHTKALSLCNK